MCWNSLGLGILMTTTGFVFLSRQDYGVLFMSRMYGSHRELELYGYVMPHSMAPESSFTILHMLYWFTRLAEIMPPVVETELAESIRVLNAHRTVPSSSSTVQIGRSAPSNFVYQQPTVNPPQFQYSLQPVNDTLLLDFKPWISENHGGGRAWYGTILPVKLPVVIKCWDSYKVDARRPDNEAEIYLKIQNLWGCCVPTLIATGC